MNILTPLQNGNKPFQAKAFIALLIASAITILVLNHFGIITLPPLSAK